MAEGNKADVEFDPFGDAQESSGGTLYKWDEVGKNIKGLYLEKREHVKTKLGEMTVYSILTKDGEIAAPGTKDLDEKMKRIPADGSMILSITFSEEVKGNFPNPFKRFSVKFSPKTDANLSALGIVLFGSEATSDDDESPL